MRHIARVDESGMSGLQVYGLVLGIVATTLGFQTHRLSVPGPSPDLSPRDVVSIQVLALQKYNSPVPNAGIWIAYRFASPANHAVTGPYGRFLRLIKSPSTRPFLHARSVEFRSGLVKGSQAEVNVGLTDGAGRSTEWLFSLSRQMDGQLKGCWLTDGVTRLR
jgi:hypothetical protein